MLLDWKGGYRLRVDDCEFWTQMMRGCNVNTTGTVSDDCLLCLACFLRTRTPQLVSTTLAR